MSLKFYTVNAFTDKAFEGTQVLVFPEADKLDDVTMKKLSREFGFPDTVFISRTSNPECAWKFRLFTQSGETRFEGHASIGAGFILFKKGYLQNNQLPQQICVEEGIGPVNIICSAKNNGDMITEFVLSQRASFDSYVPSAEELSRIFSLETKCFHVNEFQPMVVMCGKAYLIIPLREPVDVQHARYSHAAWVNSVSTSTLPQDILIFSRASGSGTHEFHARLMGEEVTAKQDPAIGSVMPAFANYLHQTDANIQAFTVLRGVGHDRLSMLNVQIEIIESQKNPVVRVGGAAVLMSEGEILL